MTPTEQFLNNTGPVSSLDDPDLNVYQTYDLTVTDGNGVTTVLLGDGDGVHSPGDPIAAPSLVGRGIDARLRRRCVTQATYDLPAGGKTYAGQADDPFFLDLRVFDLLYGGDASEVGQDTLAGYNVNTIALQVPKTALCDQRQRDQQPGHRHLEHDRSTQCHVVDDGAVPTARSSRCRASATRW